MQDVKYKVKGVIKKSRILLKTTLHESLV